VRAHDGRLFGLAVVLGVAAVAAAAWFLLGRELAVERRRLVLRAAVGAIAVVVVAAAVGAVVHAGGPVAFAKARWYDFAKTQSSPTPGRIVGTSSGNRWGWWQDAWDAWTRHPAGGTGAGSFRLTSTVRAHNPALITTEPHNVPLQFLSETGVVGLLLYLGMVAAAVMALRRRGRDRATTALTLVLALGALHQVVDIDWDYVATQGPLFGLAGFLLAEPGRMLPRRQPLQAAAVALACLAALYSLFSPWASDRRLNTGYDRVVTGDFAGAQRAAKDAHELNPLAVEPLWLWATTTSSDSEARSLYLRAAHREPQNPETWFELGYFEGEILGKWRAAYRHLDRSWHLDPFGPAGRPPGAQELDKARCKVDPSTCR
jgi:hypothetical protein